MKRVEPNDAARSRRRADLFDIASIRAELAKLVGRLSVGARQQDARQPLASLGAREDGYRDTELHTRAAQVLDAVCASLDGSGDRQRLLKALERAEGALRSALAMKQPRVPRPGKEGLPAIARQVEADLTTRLQEEPSASDEDLAAQVDVARAMRSAQALLGAEQSSEEQLKRWAKRIGIVRSSKRKWAPFELARAIFLDLAKQQGVPKPSGIARAARRNHKRSP